MHSIVEKQDKRPLLGIMFEKGSTGFYTNNARLYQDILLYFFEIKDSEFTKKYGPDTFVFNDLAGWLVTKKNTEFTNYYSGARGKTNKTSRINATRRKIQKRIDDMKAMFLLVEVDRVKARKNDQITPLYCYSDYGKILSQIVRIAGESVKPNTRKTAGEQIYTLLKSRLSPRDSALEHWRLSKYLFKSIFLDKCWKNGIFDQIVNTMIMLLHDNRSEAESVASILDYIIYDYTRFTHKKFRRSVWTSFLEALMELDGVTRKVIIYYEKLAIESKIHGGRNGSYSQLASREWEEMCFANRNEYSKLTLLGHWQQM